MERPPREQCCCFTGHREEKFSFHNIRDPGFARAIHALEDAMALALRLGCTHFLSGMCEGWDLWCAELVLRIREIRPEVTLEAVVPFVGQEHSWPADTQDYYRDMLAQAQMATVLHDRYRRGCYHERNRFLVDHASLVLAGVEQEDGGARYTMEYARKKGVQIIDVLGDTGRKDEEPSV